MSNPRPSNNPFAEFEARARALREQNALAEFDARADALTATAEEPEPKQALVRGGARAPFIQGITFGTGDEILGTLRSLPALLTDERFGDAVSENIDLEREELKRYEGEHPLRAMGANLLGAALTGRGVIQAAKSLPKLPGAARALAATAKGRPKGELAKDAGILGALYAFGASEGNPLERLPETVVGGAAGALAAPALGAAGKLGNAALDLIPGTRPRNSATTGGRLARQIADMTGGVIDRPTTRDRAMSQALDVAQQSGKSLDEMIAQAERNTKPEIVAEIMGEPGLEKALGSATARSGARQQWAEKLGARSARQLPRMVDDLSQGFGAKAGEDVFETADALQNAKIANAKPLYDKLKNIEVKDDRILQAFREPEFQRMWRAAEDVWRAEGRGKLPEIFRVVPGEGGKKKLQLVSKSIPVEALDIVKQGLDELIQRRAQSGKPITSRVARAHRNRLREMKGIVDELAPEYKAARQQWAGDSEMQEAFELGAEALKMDEREIKRWMRTATAGEKDLFRRRMFDTLQQEFRRPVRGRDVTPIVDRDAMVGKLRAAFGNDKAADLYDRMLRTESRMADSPNRILGGSNTMNKSEAVEGLGDDVTQVLDPRQLAGRFLKNRIGRMRGDVAEEIEPILSSGFDDPAKAAETLKALRDFQTRQLLADARRRQTLSRGAAPAAGTLIGQLFGRE